MYYLVNMDNNGMAPHLTRGDCEGFSQVLYIQRISWDWWWYGVRWQWRGWECSGWVWGR